MAGISAISAISLYNASSRGEKLTESTKHSLEMYGVSTVGVKTEKQGRLLLTRAKQEKMREASFSWSSSGTQEDEATRLAKMLANDLNVTFGDNDSLDDMITKLKTKINALKSQAGDDKNMLSKVNDYTQRLDLIQTSQLSQINLGTTMDIISQSNRTYFGL